MPSGHYHDEDACGPRIPGRTIDDVYKERFHCDPYDTDLEKLAKLTKAEQCFYKRANVMSSYVKNPAYRMLSASDASLRRAQIDSEHIPPIKVAYAYANDCAQKLYGNNIHKQQMNDYARTVVGDYLKDALVKAYIPIIDPGCKSKCPDIFNWCDSGVRKAIPLSKAQLEEELARMPLMDTNDYTKFTRCMNNKLIEVNNVLIYSPKHQNLNRIKQQIELLLQFSTKTNAEGRELHTRNTIHQKNYAQLRQNLNTNTLNKIGNTTRSSRPYYKKLREHIYSNRLTRKNKGNRNNLISHS